METLAGSQYYHYIFLPLLIFLARIIDVSMGTVRIIFVSRGLKLQAALIGFVEILVWLSVIGQVFKNLDNPITYIAFAAGFAAGNYVGILIEQKISIGKAMLRIITAEDNSGLLNYFRQHNVRYTVVEASGSKGDVQIIFTVQQRKKLPGLLSNIKNFNPNAFFSIEDVRQVREGDFPGSLRPLSTRRPFSRIRPFRIIKKK